MPSMQRSSSRFASGTITARTPLCRAWITMGSTPRIGRTLPSSDSSPSTHTPRSASGSMTPLHASSPSAMGRS